MAGGRSPTQRLGDRVLTRLALAAGRAVRDDALLIACYGDDEPPSGKNAVQVTVCRLKKSLPPGAITRLRGVGYRLDPAVARSLPKVDERLMVPVEEAWPAAQ